MAATNPPEFPDELQDIYLSGLWRICVRSPGRNWFIGSFLDTAPRKYRSGIVSGTLRVALRNGGVRRAISVSSLLLLDSASLLVGAFLAAGVLGSPIGAVPLLLAGWLLCFGAFGMYDRATTRRSPGALAGAAFLWAAMSIAGVLVYPSGGIGVGEVLSTLVPTIVLCVALRLTFEMGVGAIYSRGIGRVPVLLVGRKDGISRVHGLIDRYDSPCVAVGELHFEEDDDASQVSLGRLRQTLEECGASEIILSDAERLPDDELLTLLESARLRGVPMRVVPGALSLLGTSQRLHEELGIPLLEMRYPRLDNSQQAMKRALDVVLSLAGIFVLSPVFLAVWIAVRWTSPGDAVLRQKRAGADEKVFICYKFRSMYDGSEDMQPGLESDNQSDGAVFKIRNDPRITPLGHFLRRWSLDELPQLLNVLKGDMSLVGPRPLPMRDFEMLGESHKRRLAVLPGMTGYWQVRGRANLPFEEMVRLDLYYIENWSLSFDVEIISRTVGAVLMKRGAY